MMRTLEDVRKDKEAIAATYLSGELDDKAMEEARIAFRVLIDEEDELKRLEEIAREEVEKMSLASSLRSSLSLF